MSRGVTIKAHTPWDRQNSPQDSADAAPRQEVPYTCERGCRFTVPLAAEAKPPPAWGCRCGKTARLDGAPEGAPAEAALPGYTSAAEMHQRAKREPTDPWSQLRKRRSIAELDALLAARLAELRGGRA